MPSQPVVSAFAQAMYDQLDPAADQDLQYSWALLYYVAAYAAMYDQLDVLAHSNPNWSILLDPDNVPAEGLPWLAQLVGVIIDPGFTVANQRQQIKDRVSQTRGTVPAMKKALAPFLTGTKTVVIIERDTGSAYHFKIQTYSTETPPGNSYQNLYNTYATYSAFFAANATYETYWLVDQREQIRVKINAVKPAGDQYTYQVLSGSPP